MRDQFDEQAREIIGPGDKTVIAICDTDFDHERQKIPMLRALTAEILRRTDANARALLTPPCADVAGATETEAGSADARPMLTEWREGRVGFWYRALTRGGRFGAKAFKVGDRWAWEVNVDERCVARGDAPDLVAAERAADRAARRYYCLPEDAPAQAPAPATASAEALETHKIDLALAIIAGALHDAGKPNCERVVGQVRAAVARLVEERDRLQSLLDETQAATGLWRRGETTYVPPVEIAKYVRDLVEDRDGFKRSERVQARRAEELAGDLDATFDAVQSGFDALADAPAALTADTAPYCPHPPGSTPARAWGLGAHLGEKARAERIRAEQARAELATYDQRFADMHDAHKAALARATEAHARAVEEARREERRGGLAALFIGPIETRKELRDHVDRLWADAGFDAEEDDGADFVHVYKNDFRRVLEAVRVALVTPPATAGEEHK